MAQLNAGRYTVVYKDGQYRTLRVRVGKQGTRFAGARILSYKDGRDWIAFGILQDNGQVSFWRTWYNGGAPIQTDQSEKRKGMIQRAVDRIIADPEEAGMAFAMRENCCYKCGRALTVPASIHRGRGPECAKKPVTQKDNREVYSQLSQQKLGPGACGWCGAEKENAAGLCSKCGRFPALSQTQVGRQLSFSTEKGTESK